MASTIKIKRSGTAASPTTLRQGELAYSWYLNTNKLYIGSGDEDQNGAAANIHVIGGKYYVDQIDAATSANTANTIVKRDASGNISVGTITGTISGNATTASAWQTARNLSLTGDATATLTGVDGSANVSATLTLATVNSNVGTFGSATAIPVIEVNAKGLVTSVSTASVATALSIAGGTGTDTVNLLSDTLTFAGGTGVSTTVTNNQVSIAIGQAVATTSDVTFNNMTLTGYLRGPATFTIDPSTHGDNTGTVVIAGNLQVDGTTTTINSTVVSIDDKNIILADNATTAAEANGAGITVTGANATITYTSADDRWNLNKDLTVGTVYGALSGNASTATKWATARDLSLTGDATATLTGVDGNANVSATLTLANTTVTAASYGSASAVATFTVDSKGRLTAAATTSISINGNQVTSGTVDAARMPAFSGDASTTTGSTVLTLATVNSNVGTFGTSTSVPSFTVNGKGLITAVSTNAIPTATTTVLGLASFDSTNFTVTAGAVSIATVDGGTY